MSKESFRKFFLRKLIIASALIFCALSLSACFPEDHEPFYFGGSCNDETGIKHDCVVGEIKYEETCAERSVVTKEIPPHTEIVDGKEVEVPWVRPIFRDKYPGVSNKIVSCVKDLVKGVTEGQIVTIRDKVSRAVTLLLTLYIIFIGIRAVFGDISNIRGEFIVFILTALGVVFIVQKGGLEHYINVFIGTQTAVVDTVTKSIGSADDICAPYTEVWQRIDCAISRFLFADPEILAGRPDGLVGVPKGVESVGILPFAIILTLLLTPVGPFLLILSLFILLFMVAAFAQAILIFVVSLIAIVFLGLLGPIIVPMILFKRQIFNFWLEILLGYTLQPAMIMGYLAFMVNAMNYAFDTPGGLGEQYKLAQEAKFVKDPLITTCSDNQKSNAEGCGDPVSAHGGSEQTTFGMTKMYPYHDYAATIPVPPDGASQEEIDIYQQQLEEARIKEEEDNRIYGDNFLQNILVFAILLGLTLSFMANVVEFGAQLTGLSAVQAAGGINLLNTAIGRVQGALQAGGGKK